MAASPYLLPVLADCSSGHSTGAAAAGDAALEPSPAAAAWARRRLGSGLFGAVVAALGTAHCSPASRRACLDIVELVLEGTAPQAPEPSGRGGYGGRSGGRGVFASAAAAASAGQEAAASPEAKRSAALVARLLAPWSEALLVNLKDTVVAVAEGKAGVLTPAKVHATL